MNENSYYFYSMTALTRKQIVDKAHEDFMSLINQHPHKLETVKHLNYSHAYLLNETHFVFIKLRIAYTCSHGDFYYDLNPQLTCIYILWRSDNNGILDTAVVVDAKLVPNSCLHTTAESKFSAQNAENLPNYLSTYILQDSAKHLINNVTLLSQSHMRMTRLIQYDAIKNLESRTFEMIEKFVQGHSFASTWEGCKADCMFAPNGSNGVFLGIQLKTSNYGQAYKRWEFHSCDAYNEMIVILHPLNDDSNACYFVIPGQTATTRISMYNLHDCKWTPYLVSEDQICQFLETLYTAVRNGDEYCIWPSGNRFPIGQMKLHSKDVLTTPISKNCQIEHASRKQRLMRFPELSYILAPQNLTYDAIINDIKIQDKAGYGRKNKTGGQSERSATTYRVAIHKHAGTINGLRKYGPYADGDFEALWVYLPGRNEFFLIPAYELTKRGYLATNDDPGKQTIYCYSSRYEKFGNRPAADTWTSKYYIPDDDSALAKVQNLLNKLKPSLLNSES